MRKIIIAFFMVLGLTFVGAQVKAEGIAVGAGVGTMGYGVHLSTEINSFLVMRVNGNFGSFTVPDMGLMSDSMAGLDYDIEAQMKSVGLIADIHPLGLSPIGGGLVLSGGIYYNRNEFELSTGTLGNVTVGGNLYAAPDLIANYSFDQKYAPYAGLGYDGTFQGVLPVSFFLTAGVLFQGSPSVSIVDTTGQVIPADLATEAQQLEDDASSFEYYPVIAMGISISF